MKKIVFCLLLLPYLTLAQNESQAHKPVMDALVSHYNAKEYKDIFNLYSESLKEAVPLVKVTTFFKGLDGQMGNIEKFELIKLQFKVTAIYKTTFERGIVNVKLTLNKDNDLSGMYFVPFVAESKTVNVKSALNFKDINKKQLKKIYNHSKKFPNNTQLSIAIITNGKAQYLGIKRENNTLLEIDNHNKVFEIGSISKVFTSTLLAKLVVENQVKLDDLITKYLDFPLHDNAQISFKELASHHSGLSGLPSNFESVSIDKDNPYKNYGEKQLKDYLENIVTLNDKVYAYSNLGASLLAYTLGQITDKNYQQLLDTYIFNPLSMTLSTTIKKDIEKHLIIGLNPEGGETANWDLNAHAGAGAILSTVEDMSKFAQAQFDESNKVFALTRTKTFDASNGMEIGLGWHLIKQGKDKNIYWHNGGTGGYSSSMIVDVKDKKAVIILSNVSSYNTDMKHIDGLAFDLMQTL